MPYTTLGEPSIIAPDGNPKIWRYVDMIKYVSMLSDRGLFFARCDSLGDRFEGSLPLVAANLLDREASDARQRQWLTDEIHAYLTRTAVCCWHMNESESWPMWKTYGDAGIAIVSDFGRLVHAVRNVVDGVFIGKVEYLDFDDPKAENLLKSRDWTSVKPLMTKRNVFASERELRAAICRTSGIYPADEIQGGLLVPVDLNELVMEVRVSPSIERWGYRAIRDVTWRYGLRAPVRQSAMSGEPRR